MKAKDLFEILKNVDPEADIVLAKDAEGNSFSVLADVDTAKLYREYPSFLGEAHDLDMIDVESYDEDFSEKIKQAFVLWPT